MEEHQFQIETLLNRNKSLSEEGYSFSLQKRLPKRKKGVESYHFLDASFYMEIILDKRSGFNRISFFDLFKHKESHFRWKSGSFFYIQDVDEKEEIFHGLFPNFGENGEALHFEIEFEKEDSFSFSYASKGEKKKSYLYRQLEYVSSLNGYLKFGEKLFSLKQTKSFYQFELDASKSSSTLYQTYFIGYVKDKLLASYLAKGHASEKTVSPNFAFHGSKPFKLSSFEFKDFYDGKKELDLTKLWRLSSLDGSVELSFQPTCFFRRKLGLFHRKHRQICFGHFDGYMILDGEKLYIEHLFGYIDKKS